MITECSEDKKDRILRYIGRDYGRCLYIYIDLKKYRLDETEDFRAWIQEDGEGRITCVVTEYFGGIQLYSRDSIYDGEEMAAFLGEKDPAVILGMEDTVTRIRPFMTDMHPETGTVGQIEKVTAEAGRDVCRASAEELSDVVSLVAADEAIGRPYGYDSLYRQYRERMEEGFGRNMIMRSSDGDIIGHAGTYAELPELAVVGGVITAPAYRGRGYSVPVLAALCRDLLAEGKDVFSYYYIPAAGRMHEAAGFRPAGRWAKLVR